MAANPTVTPPDGSTRAGPDPLNATISEALKALARAVRSFQLYLPNNPMHARAIDSARAAFELLWRSTENVELTVSETDFLRDDVSLLSETDRGGESLPWLFYKDGIRTFEIRRGFETRELSRFLAALQAVRAQAGGDEDLVTLFWECDFECFSYRYEEAGGDGYDAPGSELLAGGAPPGAVAAPADSEAEVGTYGSSPSQFARIGDFDPTLYFLEEREIAYLQQSVTDDYSADVRLSVAAALLDTFEGQNDPTVREEICAILEQFLLVLLSSLQFRSAAFLIRECALAGSRADALLSSHRDRLTQLANQVSDASTLNQLLDVLEDSELTPPQQDLVSLFTQLSSEALRPLVAHLVRTRNSGLRALVESAVNRLAASNTEALTALIGADDESVSIEAIRRCGHLKSPAAVGHLASVVEAGSDNTRAAAVEALSRIASPGALRALEVAIDDTERDIRIAVVRASAANVYKPIVPRIERAIRDRLIRDGSSAEKTAFFEAYVTLAGDASIPLLESILVPRGLLSKKEEPATRATAAVALGRLGTERALDVVRKVSGDKEVVVRSAAARALRGIA
ncbi:MAG: HEAT repeat domain-containing protein [Gemmatimonadota bacterium]|nr:HEAT repeat domain-containing protein [Gemmatimonadota bacterium]